MNAKLLLRKDHIPQGHPGHSSSRTPSSSQHLPAVYPMTCFASTELDQGNRDGTRLTENRKGVADEELAKKEVERSRKRRIDEDDHMNGSRKRSRSLSSTSVSTISTNLSRSPSPKHVSHGHTGQSQLLANLDVDRKRRRSPSTSMSYTSDTSHGKTRRDRSRSRDNNARRWRSSASPDVHRRAIDHRQGSRDRAKGQGHRRRPYSRSRSISYASESSLEDYRKRPTHGENRSKRRRHSSRSPDDRGRDRDLDGNRGSRRTKSPCESRDRSQVIKNRKSMTPGIPSRQVEETRGHNHRPSIDRGHRYAKDNDRYGGSARVQDDNVRSTRPPLSAPPSRKDRSLSPFSKRLMLTQAMNMGR